MVSSNNSLFCTEATSPYCRLSRRRMDSSSLDPI